MNPPSSDFQNVFLLTEFMGQEENYNIDVAKLSFTCNFCSHKVYETEF